MKKVYRSRLKYAILIIITIILGLASRKCKSVIPVWTGDVLWALMVFFIFGFIFKKASTLRTAVYAIIFSYSIEVSQLYHEAWIDSIRNTTLGGLVLGYSFLWSDILCYTAGILIGVVFEKYKI